jgi:hypothetical protein
LSGPGRLGFRDYKEPAGMIKEARLFLGELFELVEDKDH